MALLGRVHELCHHADDLVRRAAADVARTMPVLAVGESWGRFQAQRAAKPGHSVLLGAMDVSDRRQVLRWLGHDRVDANEHVLAALRTGLDDDDDEVRITAALVAARLGAGTLAGAV
ncbi:MAG: hypothetical protein AB1730_09050 [Myxococcota bacterium]